MTRNQHFRIARFLAQPSPTVDEALLASPGKEGEIGLAEVVLASASASKRKWRHSSVPKDGTEGKDAGAEGKSSSSFSSCWPKLV